MKYIIRNSMHKDYAGCQDFLNDNAPLELVNVVSIIPLYDTKEQAMAGTPSKYQMLSVWRKH